MSCNLTVISMRAGQASCRRGECAKALRWQQIIRRLTTVNHSPRKKGSLGCATELVSKRQTSEGHSEGPWGAMEVLRRREHGCPVEGGFKP